MKRKGYLKFEILIILLLSAALVDVKFDLINKTIEAFKENTVSINKQEVKEAIDKILLTKINNGSPILDITYTSKFNNEVNIVNGVDCGYDITINLIESDMVLYVNTCSISNLEKYNFKIFE